MKAGYIRKGEDLEIEDINDFQPHQVNKKKAVHASAPGENCTRMLGWWLLTILAKSRSTGMVNSNHPKDFGD